MKLELVLIALFLIVARPIKVYQSTLKNPSLKLLNLHNRNRDLTADYYNKPGASNMQTMQWSSELEQLATDWTNTCSDIAPDAIMDSNGAKLGMNVNFEQSWEHKVDIDTYNVPDMVYKSFAQIFETPNKKLNSLIFDASQPNISKYTQFVWAETNLVGCAITLCRDDSNQERPNHLHNLCLYSTKGNVEGRPIYKTGPRCSDTGCKCNSEWSALCDLPNITKQVPIPINSSVVSPSGIYSEKRDQFISISFIKKCGMTQQLRQEVLDSHNKFRQMVASGNFPGQPPASNMNILKYSRQLEEYASQWVVLSLLYTHEKQKFDRKGTFLSQNRQIIILTKNEDNNQSINASFASNAVQSWLNNGPGSVSFDNLVKAGTIEVGCGVVQNINKGYQMEQTLLCLYRGDRSANASSQSYSQGTGCSSCKGSCNSHFNALCGQPTDYGVTSAIGFCGQNRPRY